MILTLTALTGSRLFYLVEHGDLLCPSAWLGGYGFAFYGGFTAATVRTPRS